MVRTFLACLATGCGPAIWGQVKVASIPATGRSFYSGPSDFRLTVLTSFLLKTMERLVDRFLRYEALAAVPFIPASMLIRLGNPWKQSFISSYSGLKRCLTSRRQL
jgi:hypothetical protein